MKAIKAKSVSAVQHPLNASKLAPPKQFQFAVSRVPYNSGYLHYRNVFMYGGCLIS